jgi:hypothetical protein
MNQVTRLAIMEKVASDVGSRGWSAVHVMAEDHSVGFSYTIGLHQTYAFPEIVVFSLPPLVAHGIFDSVVGRLKSKRPPDLLNVDDELLESCPCCFVKASPFEIPLYARVCQAFYAGRDFSLYQLVWPSPDGLFPWHEAASPEFKAVQPVLGQGALH